ncbi:MAG: hypothetical protein ACYTBJ_11465 [Planctomycetota bacterium]|jgi:hypothetical protein
MNEPGKHSGAQGIAGLPRPWSTAVQLVGTFGLAVFLVLYYVLVMQPRERARYDELTKSVEWLIAVVEKGHTLLPASQIRKLERLYILAVSDELAVSIQQERAKGASPDELAEKLKQIMLNRTELLQGFVRKDNRNISETLVHRIASREGVHKLLAQEAHNWDNLSVPEMTRICEEKLSFAFAEKRMAK